MNEKLDVITTELYSKNIYELMADNSDEGERLWDNLIEKAHQAIDTYGWDEVFKSWEQYMLENCHSVEEAINYATWFYTYGGSDQIISDPYTFLAPLYDIFDLHPVQYDAQIMDDVSYGLLMAAGIKKHLWSDDYYTTETDPKMIEAVEKYRKEKSKVK